MLAGLRNVGPVALSPFPRDCSTDLSGSGQISRKTIFRNAFAAPLTEGLGFFTRLLDILKIVS